MNCPNCKSAKAKSIITINEEGGSLSIRCDICYPKKFGKKAMLGSAQTTIREDDVKFKQYELPPSEVQKNQALRPGVMRKATPEQRYRDDVDRILAQKRVKIYEMADPRLAARRNERVLNKARGLLGTDNLKIVSDNGFEVIVEVAA